MPHPGNIDIISTFADEHLFLYNDKFLNVLRPKGKTCPDLDIFTDLSQNSYWHSVLLGLWDTCTILTLNIYRNSFPGTTQPSGLFIVCLRTANQTSEVTSLSTVAAHGCLPAYKYKTSIS